MCESIVKYVGMSYVNNIDDGEHDPLPISRSRSWTTSSGESVGSDPPNVAHAPQPMASQPHPRDWDPTTPTLSQMIHFNRHAYVRQALPLPPQRHPPFLIDYLFLLSLVTILVMNVAAFFYKPLRTWILERTTRRERILVTVIAWGILILLVILRLAYLFVFS